ncbi:MAG: SDR family NAD(P)-dependent oxidoreductase [Labilithrix sp.]|nr:SDR family NAD(P)-dependent oxidoreductase [Labilithrix sp.]
MTKKKVLITGGAGFIGSHLADALLERGHAVRALDNLSPQVHGREAARPAHLDRRVELIVGDVRDGAAVERALDGVDAVVHLAAAVGVGRSMYEVERYTSVNNLGTAVLMDRIVRRPVERLVVASSMTVYGEGLYLDPSGAPREVVGRTLEQLRRAEWDPRLNGRRLEPTATPETKAARIDSVYALSKHDQERMCLVLGRAHGIPTVALRLFNVFGPRQSLSSPYSGVLLDFALRILGGRAPLVHEDGEQRRDFVSVRDVARAFCLALESEGASGAAINVGSGAWRTLAQVARKVAQLVGRPHLVPEITRTYRAGEPRHCYADTRRAEQVLGYRAAVDFDDALVELARWLKARRAEVSDLDPARLENGGRPARVAKLGHIHESGAPALSNLEGPHAQ